MDTVALAAAVNEWQRIVGSAYVIVNSDALSAAGTATFTTTAAVHAIVKPASREEVQACVRTANSHRVPLYPVSSGKNWGYGSRAPVLDGVILDLERLNRIVAFSEELAYVTIEPGVTQSQLQEFLRERNSRLWMDATGASPDCSIIGNTMERGFGHTPMGDHLSNACGFEVVMPDGSYIETGFSRFRGSKVGPMSRYGLGPSIDGLFSQSNLGVVTRMTVWLMPAPERFVAFFFTSRHEDSIAGIIDALRPLRLNGVLRGVMHIVNDYKVLSATGQFPWETTQGRTPLDLATVRKLRNELGIGTWNGSGALYGTPGQVRDAKARLRDALKGKVTRLQFIDDRLIALMGRFAAPFRLLTGWDIRRTLAVIRPVYGLMKGIPSHSTMGSVYWRKRMSPPPEADQDPDRDRCGLLWCSPVLPNTGADAQTVSDIVTDVLLEHGFEPQLSFSVATERSLICVITISFDRDRPGEDGKAMKCYSDVSKRLLELGYPPYRLNVAMMGSMATDDTYDDVIRRLKVAFDPQGILAPGRYEPSIPLQRPTVYDGR